ncbi:MAG: hypothetical protein ACOZNI_22125 [Myxococcota bacterium]
MLPRFEHLFGVTAGWQVFGARALSPRWTGALKASGFVTRVLDVPITQASLLILNPQVWWEAGDHVVLGAGVLGEVPGTALNDNTLQTVTAQLTVEAGF